MRRPSLSRRPTWRSPIQTRFDRSTGLPFALFKDASQDRERVIRMRMQLAAIRREWILAKTGRRQMLSPEDRERLRTLGYVSDD